MFLIGSMKTGPIPVWWEKEYYYLSEASVHYLLERGFIEIVPDPSRADYYKQSAR